ncbi:DUF5077 domain-containing protein [Elizabethkingia ursingii]|uniref:DUF3472 domain-containing protein n=1 Tax=Elizabethkingia ursingii TaxID=1756150 RepID=UPI002011FF5B|nr:DUF5077 domain-containing protein [Elizabethkingia ursingii]MCL1666728.1 DUF5077 domain-containing protein [Elizabethkingia ursingii]
MKITSLTTIIGIFFFMLILITGCQRQATSISDYSADYNSAIIDSSLTVRIPMSGNSYITAGNFSGAKIIDMLADPKKQNVYDLKNYGVVNWKDSTSVISTYIKLQNTGVLNLGIRAKVSNSESKIKLSVNGDTFTKTLKQGSDTINYYFGSVDIKEPGYIKIDLKGISRTDSKFIDFTDLIIGGTAVAAGKVNYVAKPSSSGFYFARRGSSLNLSYTKPSGNQEYMYHEISIPKGYDPIGLYAMSNGFSGGYMGLQVNSETERRVLFSVWNPSNSNGKTVIVNVGKDVDGGSFAGEGEGTNCKFKFMWKTDTTYKFITRIRPDGNGNTLFTSWFYAPEIGEWKYIATFRRPQITKYVENAGSFLENFSNSNGYLPAKAYYSNMWFKGATGNWIPATGAKLSLDGIAKNGARLDYQAGFDNNGYYMKHNGYFNEYGADTNNFVYPTTPAPSIDVATLPLN